VLRIASQMLRVRGATLAGAFVAIWLAVTLAYAAGLLLTGALSPPGAGRFAAADAVVRADPRVELGHDLGSLDVSPAPRLDDAVVARVAAVPGVARAVGDIAFAAGARDAAGRPVDLAGRPLYGHAWDGAVLTPYELRSGAAPRARDEVVVDARTGVGVGDRIRVSAPGGDGDYRVAGVASAPAGVGREQALFFATGTARELSGAPEQVSSVGVVAAPGTSGPRLRADLARRLGSGVEVLDSDRAAEADPASSPPEERDRLVAMFGTMAGIAGAIAIFVVAGTFALAIAQRRRETAVLRALGATPRQVRRLIAAEAFIVSLVAGALGVLAGAPLADLIVDVLVEHGAAPAGFEPARSWVPLAAAIGLGIGIAQLAVIAAGWRAGRTRPAEALRDAAVEHTRPGAVQVLAGLLCLGGGAVIALVFSGLLAQAFSVLAGLLLAAGAGLLGRLTLGVPAAALARPLRAFGAAGLLASTALSANRWRTAAVAAPIVLVVMLAGTQGLVQFSDQQNTERVTAERVTAAHVVTGADGAPLAAATAGRVAALDGVRGVAEVVPTEIYGLDHGLGENSPWAAAGVGGPGSPEALDLGVVAGDLGDVHGDAIAISRVVADDGGLSVGDVIAARLADTDARSLRVAAVYDRAAGLGDIVMDATVARRHEPFAGGGAVFAAGGPPAERSLAAYADAHDGVSVRERSEYLETVRSANQEGAWGVWMIIGIATLFAALALVNTAAMATGERTRELATIRLLGGTRGQVVRMIALETAATVAVALAAGAAIVLVAVAGVPRGVAGVPLEVPGAPAAGLLAGAVALGLGAMAVAARPALRASPAAAVRTGE
jgi:putative ABC transport system permease protein